MREGRSPCEAVTKDATDGGLVDQAPSCCAGLRPRIQKPPALTVVLED